MSRAAKPAKGAAQLADAELKKIAKRNEATPKGAIAAVMKGVIRAMQAKR